MVSYRSRLSGSSFVIVAVVFSVWWLRVCRTGPKNRRKKKKLSRNKRITKWKRRESVYNTHFTHTNTNTLTPNKPYGREEQLVWLFDFIYLLVDVGWCLFCWSIRCIVFRSGYWFSLRWLITGIIRFGVYRISAPDWCASCVCDCEENQIAWTWTIDKIFKKKNAKFQRLKRKSKNIVRNSEKLLGKAPITNKTHKKSAIKNVEH